MDCGLVESFRLGWGVKSFILLILTSFVWLGRSLLNTILSFTALIFILKRYRDKSSMSRVDYDLVKLAIGKRI